jgi:UDP-2,3-diacylglucosamine pyrophosphatase LpxH
MCTPHARQRLARFIRYAAAQRHEQQDVRLVINGDIVDFLAEEGAKPFLGNDARAQEVLKNIMDRTDEVWTALRNFTQSGAALTLLLGNHDIELSLPGPRRLLLERLGPGRVEFIYDNQAFVDGPVLIEHGNRYDTWNMVPHNRLRQVRAQLSRGEKPRRYPNVPGSDLVCKVVNRLKKKYRFVDLLKPETEAVLPALPALDPTPGGYLERVVNGILAAWPFVRSTLTGIDSRGRPTDPEYVSRNREVTEAQRKVEDALRLAKDWQGILDREAVSFTQVDFMGLRELWDAAKEHRRRSLIEKLRQKWRHTSRELQWGFRVSEEAPTWLVPAQASADAGFKVVIYGHTHLAKQVKLKGGARISMRAPGWTSCASPLPYWRMGKTPSKNWRGSSTTCCTTGSSAGGGWCRPSPASTWTRKTNSRASVFTFSPTKERTRFNLFQIVSWSKRP